MDWTDEEYQSGKEEVVQQLEALPGEKRVRQPDVEKVAALLKDFDSLYKAASPDERKLLFQALFRKVYVFGGKIKAVEPVPSCGPFSQPPYLKRGRRGSLPTVYKIYLLPPLKRWWKTPPGE
jgi:hypothetical protein